jgi:hypothetical protein
VFSAPEAAKAFEKMPLKERDAVLLDRAAFERVVTRETGKARYYRLAVPLGSGWMLRNETLEYAEAERERQLVQSVWSSRSVGLVRIDPSTQEPWHFDDWQERLDHSAFALRERDPRAEAPLPATPLELRASLQEYPGRTREEQLSCMP